MSLKEEVYQAVHDYIKERVEQLNEALENNDPGAERIQHGLIELLKVQRLIYKKFADYNEKLAQEGYEEFIRPVRIDTNELVIKKK